MAKPKIVFACQSCGTQASKWLGKCPACGEWNTFVEERETPVSARDTRIGGGQHARPVPLAEVDGSDADRAPTGLSEFDRVLGGGLVAGSLVLVGGEPGVGKSTLLLQASLAVAESENGGARPVLYVTGEETARQVRMRAERLGRVPPALLVHCETDLTAILEAARANPPRLLIVDSIQTVFLPDLSSAPGSVGQVRECGQALMVYAKSTGVPTMLVGHVTKEGTIAGPRVLEHLVDTVLYFEGDRSHAFRILRAVKNRFGSASELGIFEMTGNGLAAVADPSRVLLTERPRGAPGSVVTAALEGSRPMLLEVQALVAPTRFGYPQRQVTGLDANRCAMLLAVVDRRAGFGLANADVFLSVAGGVSAREPAADLAIALATVSSQCGEALDPATVVFGEVGLAGEVRSVPGIDARLREAAQLGFLRAIVPAAAVRAPSTAPIEIRPAATLAEAIEAAGLSGRSQRPVRVDARGNPR